MFNVDKEESAKLNEWLKKHDESCRFADPEKQGAIGGRLTYSFTPTSLGCVAKVRCACGGEVDLTNYEHW